MPNIAGTGVPAAVTATCPRCKALRTFMSIGPEVSYRCAGCEWPFTFGAGSSPLSTNGAVTAGVTTALPFASGGTQFSVRQVLFINDGASSEIVAVNGTPTGTSVPIADLDFNHNSGVAVSLAVATPSGTGDVVPANPGWGF
jgi:hypothetical protein